MSRGIDRGGRSQARRNRGVWAEGRPSPPGDGIMTTVWEILNGIGLFDPGQRRDNLAERVQFLS